MIDLNLIWHWPALNFELGISSEAYTFLRSQSQANGENEKGGQLFMSAAHPEGLVIEIATPSNPMDKAGRHWVELDKKRCKEEIIQYNKMDLTLIGYWHTHPEFSPNISAKDIQSFKEFSLRNNESLPTPIAIIVGQSPSPEGVRIWSIQQSGPVLAVRKQSVPI